MWTILFSFDTCHEIYCLLCINDVYMFPGPNHISYLLNRNTFPDKSGPKMMVKPHFSNRL